MLDQREFEAIKARAEAIRRCIQKADKAETMKEYENAAVLLLSGNHRVDDDLFMLIEEVARLRGWKE